MVLSWFLQVYIYILEIRISSIFAWYIFIWADNLTKRFDWNHAQFRNVIIYINCMIVFCFSDYYVVFCNCASRTIECNVTMYVTNIISDYFCIPNTYCSRIFEATVFVIATKYQFYITKPMYFLKITAYSFYFINLKINYNIVFWP